MATTNILDLNNRLEKLENKPGGAGGDAEDIGYDNSTSHLTADNVQAAIDEVVADIADLSADDVAYDPTASGLQSTNVQDAIDEVASDLSGLSADDVTYDNTDSGLSSDTVQGAIDETVNKIDNINDDLNGFCFYPSGTAIVGLVSDDSPYTDANGNYILAASTTGQSMIDDVTYKSINSTIDARGKVGADSATPFSKGGGDIDIDLTNNYIRNNITHSSASPVTYNTYYQSKKLLMVFAYFGDRSGIGLASSDGTTYNTSVVVVEYVNNTTYTISNVAYNSSITIVEVYED